MKFSFAIAGFAAVLTASTAFAQEYNLRFQSHYAPDSPQGLQAQVWIDDVQTMSGGRVAIEMFWSSSVVASTEGSDAAGSGILDGEIHGGAYLGGKNRAFQFIGDPMGGYNTPWEMYGFLYQGGGLEAANELYSTINLRFVGWWGGGQESLASSAPLAGPDDLKDWKFRSPPGLETEIFAGLGASPIVMDFTEIFTALETGIIDGADASNLATNTSLGLYDIVKHATYPGFHSMPMDHVTLNLDVWNGLPDDIKRIFEVSVQKLALQTTLSVAAANGEAVVALREQGVTLHDWSVEDRAAFRAGAQSAWDGYADTPEAKSLVEAHRAWMRQIGLL